MFLLFCLFVCFVLFLFFRFLVFVGVFFVCFFFFFAGRPMLVCPWVGVHSLLWVRPYFSTCAQHVLFSLFGSFNRWVVSGYIAYVLWGASSRICLKQNVASFHSFHPTFSPCVSLDSGCSNYTIVLTMLQHGRIPVLFNQRDQISVWSLTCQ